MPKLGKLRLCVKLANIAKDPNREHIQDRIYDPSGLAPTLNTVGGGNLEPKITIDGTIGPHETDRITNKGGMVQTLKATDYKNPPKIVIDGLTRDTQKQKARVFNPNGLSATITATDYKGTSANLGYSGQLKGGEGKRGA